MTKTTAITEAKRGPASLVERFAARFHVEPTKLMSTLKSTCFKSRQGEPTNEEMMALVVVADQYKLNPFTKELFAFDDGRGGIIPVVSVDGWSRIINEHPQFDGLDFRYSDAMAQIDEHHGDAHEWIECVIYRKDRTHPTVVREYFAEVYRKPFKKGDRVIMGPWQSHPRRFHRHKALIQGARVAFGFAGIYDTDEAERIIESEIVEEARQDDLGTADRAKALLGGPEPEKTPDSAPSEPEQSKSASVSVGGVAESGETGQSDADGGQDKD